MQRRDFLSTTPKAVAALAVGGGVLAACDSRPADHAVESLRATGKVIDFHAHCELPGIRELMGGTSAPDAQLTLGAHRLASMDEHGIDIAVFSINPFWYDLDERLAGLVIQAQNRRLAEACAAAHGRFVGVATVALQHPQLAADQLEEAVTTLGLRGVSVGTVVGRHELSSPSFDPFWARAEALDVPVFIHPLPVSELDGRLAGNGMLGHVIGSPLATTIALSHLIFEGTLDRFPRLTICAAHGGGYLPTYVGRSDYGCTTRPHECAAPIERLPSDYLKGMYFDALVFTEPALQHLVSVAGASRIVLATDDPYPWTGPTNTQSLPRYRPVDQVRNAAFLSPSDRAAILGGNAARLLKLDA